MEVIKVTEEDAKRMAGALDLMSLVSKLVDSLRLAGLPIQGPGIQDKEHIRQWLNGLAQGMAADLRKQKAEKPMAVKSIAVPQKLTSSKPSSKKKK